MSYPLAFAKSEFERRAAAVTARMDDAGLDALVAYSVRNSQGPVAYLGGYEPDLGLHDVAYFVLIPGESPDAILVTNGFWDDPAARTWVEDVVISYKFERSLRSCCRAARRGSASWATTTCPLRCIWA